MKWKAKCNWEFGSSRFYPHVTDGKIEWLSLPVGSRRKAAAIAGAMARKLNKGEEK